MVVVNWDGGCKNKTLLGVDFIQDAKIDTNVCESTWNITDEPFFFETPYCNLQLEVDTMSISGEMRALPWKNRKSYVSVHYYLNMTRFLHETARLPHSVNIPSILRSLRVSLYFCI